MATTDPTDPVCTCGECPGDDEPHGESYVCVCTNWQLEYTVGAALTLGKEALEEALLDALRQHLRDCKPQQQLMLLDTFTRWED